MSTALARDEVPPPPSAHAARHAASVTKAAQLPESIASAVWRGTELGQGAGTAVSSSGWPALDVELPGGGWPTRAVTEVLTSQPAMLEWRLLAPALRPVVASGGQVVVIGPPRPLHMPGLVMEGLSERQLVWIQVERPAERLWVTEQLVKSNAAGAIVAWLPHARQEQLRRLQVCAAGCESLVFLCRPEAARHEASAAPLRVLASLGLDWELHLRIIKRRGPAHDGLLALPSVPAGLAAVLPPRLRKPSLLIHDHAALGRPSTRDPSRTPHREVGHALGRPVVPVAVQQLTAIR